MKRTLLSVTLALAGTLAGSAQTETLIDRDFDQAADYADVLTVDADGDGWVWGYTLTPIDNSEEVGINGGFLYSASYDQIEGVGIEPDNLLMLPVVSIPLDASDIVATIKIGALDFDNYAEHYGVYAIPGDEATTDLILEVMEGTTDAAEVVALLGEPLLEQTIAGGPTASWKTVLLEEFAGQDVRLVVRHFNCFDQYYIGVDGFKVTATILGVNDFASSLATVYPNPATNVINFSLDGLATASSIRIMDLHGRVVRAAEVSGSQDSVDVSGLSSGMYVLEIETSQGKAVKKIVKN